MFNLYGVAPGEVWWCGSDIGWVVGHSYIVYGAAVFHGATSIMYEGKPVGTPDAGAFWRVIAEHKAAAFFNRADRFPAPIPRRRIPNGTFIPAIRPCKIPCAVLAGEGAPIRRRLAWAEAQLKVPVIDHWWQTETGWWHCRQSDRAGPAAGEAWLADGCRCRAIRSKIVDEAARPVPAGTMGSIVIKLPMAAGLACRHCGSQDERFFGKAYLSEFPGYYKTSERPANKDADGLRVRDGPHRRHHQCRGPQALDRRHGGDSGVRTPGRGPNARCSGSMNAIQGRGGPAASWC